VNSCPNERDASAKAARYAADLRVHERGQQMLHLEHPFARTACVMNPALMLHFCSWVTLFAPKDCPLAASGAMMPGSVKIPMPRGMTLKSE
jgi:hypothetical protein